MVQGAIVTHNQIISKIESGNFTKDELSAIAKACAVAIFLQNYDESGDVITTERRRI